MKFRRLRLSWLPAAVAAGCWVVLGWILLTTVPG